MADKTKEPPVERCPECNRPMRRLYAQQSRPHRGWEPVAWECTAVDDCGLFFPDQLRTTLPGLKELADHEDLRVLDPELRTDLLTIESLDPEFRARLLEIEGVEPVVKICKGDCKDQTPEISQELHELWVFCPQCGCRIE
jgi:hypothetical protein